MALYSKNNQPKNLSREQKRHVVATDQGWARIVTKGTRVLTNLLVYIRNMTAGNAPNIVDVYFDATSGAIGQARTVNVVFDEPVKFGATPTDATIVVENRTTPASPVTGTMLTTASYINAQNTLVFTFTPTVAGTYGIGSAITIGGGPIVSRNKDAAAVTSMTIPADIATQAGTLVIT